MRRAKAILLSAGLLSVIAAAAWAQQTYYAQKPSPAVPAGEQAMSYDQALQLQQSWRKEPQAAPPAQPEATGSAEAAPVGVDPDGNPVFGAVPNSQQALPGSSSRNEAQIAADRLRQDPNAAAESYGQQPQADPGSYAPQAQPSAPQTYAQPQYQQPSPQQQGYAAPNQVYSYAQPAPQTAQVPPASVAEPYGAYPPPPPPVVAYGYPYPYPYYGFGVRVGGYYGGPYYRGYPYRGYVRGPVFRGPVVRGGFAVAGRGFAGGGRIGGYARVGRR